MSETWTRVSAVAGTAAIVEMPGSSPSRADPGSRSAGRIADASLGVAPFRWSTGNIHLDKPVVGTAVG